MSLANVCWRTCWTLYPIILAISSDYIWLPAGFTTWNFPWKTSPVSNRTSCFNLTLLRESAWPKTDSNAMASRQRADGPISCKKTCILNWAKTAKNGIRCVMSFSCHCHNVMWYQTLTDDHWWPLIWVLDIFRRQGAHFCWWPTRLLR